MLFIQWLLHCLLAFITTTFSQHIQYPLTPALQQPVQLDNPELSNNPLYSLHKNLVNIESTSGNEQAAGEYLEAYLTSHNYTVERQYLEPLPRSLGRHQAQNVRPQKQRFNLLAYPGERRQTPVLLSSVSALWRDALAFRHLSLHICCMSKRLVVTI